MTMKGKLYLLFIFLVLFWLVYAQESAPLPIPVSEDVVQLCASEERPFESGEKLTYSIYYNLNFIWIRAGEVEFTIFDEGDYYQAKAVGSTISTFEWFVKVHDVYECSLTKDDLKPIHTIRDIHEGNYTKYTEGRYDYDKDLVFVEVTDRHGKKKNVTYDIENCAQDILSLAYQARGLDYGSMQMGQQVKARMILDDDPIYNIQFAYEGLEEIKVKKLGKAECTRLSPRLFNNSVFSEKDKMNIWVSNDQNRIPLMLETAISVGSIKVVLKSYERLKYPLEAFEE